LHPGEKAPDDKALSRWLKQFTETGSVAKQKSSVGQGTLEEDMEHIRQSCVSSPIKSIARWSLELGIPKTTIPNVTHKRLHLYAYKFQLKHEPISILHTIKQTQPSVTRSTFCLTLIRTGR
jgi:hypothetical protein